MKELVRKVARKLSRMPFVGRFVHIAGAIWRLPQLRASYGELRTVYAEQLPALLDAVSKLNAKQHAIDQDRENLVASVPVALRTMQREIHVSREDIVRLDDELKMLHGSAAKKESLDEALARLEILNSHMGELRGTCSYLLGRVEFVRRELMFEMRYGARSDHAGNETLDTVARVIAGDKLEAASAQGLKLNLGCGHIPLDGFINVDRRELPGVDVVAEINALPKEIQEAAEIFSSHMLEHFPQEQLRRELLPYWKSLLKKGGTIRAVVPDAEAMIREYQAGRYPYDDMREVLYGAQDYDGDFHYNMFTPEHMIRLLEEAGFESAKVIEAGRKNGRCFEFEIVATRP
jgi:predicted SAM-dependent methyltransferase